MMSHMSEITRVLKTIEAGNPQATDELLPLVYDKLRKMAARKLANEKPGQTLSATALVHEAYMKLAKPGGLEGGWQGQRHFFAAAAQAMRRILMNRARDKNRLKRGGDRQRLSLDLAQLSLDEQAEELIELDEAIENLKVEKPVVAELVTLRFFAGLSLGDAAKTLGIGRRTADRYWAYARAWLYKEIREKNNGWTNGQNCQSVSITKVSNLICLG